MKYSRLPDLILLITAPAILVGGLAGHFLQNNVLLPVSPVLFLLGVLAAVFFTVKPGNAFSSKFSIYLLGAYFCLFSVFNITNVNMPATILVWVHTVFIFLAVLSALQEAQLMDAFDSRKNIFMWGVVFVGFATLTLLAQPPFVAIVAGSLLCVSMRYTHMPETKFSTWVQSVQDRVKKRDFFLDNHAIAFWAGLAFCVLSAFTNNDLFRLICGLIVCVSMMHIFDRRWPFAIVAATLLIFYGLPLP